MNRNYLLAVGHGGLGDHIIMNVIYRELAKRHELVCIPVKYRNCASVEYMLKDVPNIVIRPIEDDGDMLFFRDNVWKDQVLNLGCFGHPFDGSTWDTEFFRQAGVEFTDRWNKWECPRDGRAEERVFAQYGNFRRGDQKHFVFMHEDYSRDLRIDMRKSEHLTNWPYPGTSTCQPEPSLTPILFHYRKVIEACDEIHVIASSFAAFIDSIPLPKNPKLFLHAYARPGEPLMKVNKNWEVLK